MSVFKQYEIDRSIEDELSNKDTTYPDIENNELVIAVMDRGWVFVGFITKLEQKRIRLDCCHNIHNWGTTKGLGELSIKGPLADTQLFESSPIIGVPILLMKTNRDNW